MKIWKWLLGLLGTIGGIVAIFAGSKSNKKVRELKSKIKDNEKETKAIDEKIAGVKETDEYLKKTIADTEKALKETKKAKKTKPKKKSASKAKSKLKNIGNATLEKIINVDGYQSKEIEEIADSEPKLRETIIDSDALKLAYGLKKSEKFSR